MNIHSITAQMSVIGKHDHNNVLPAHAQQLVLVNQTVYIRATIIPAPPSVSVHINGFVLVLDGRSSH